jgi:hypothetical protein
MHVDEVRRVSHGLECSPSLHDSAGLSRKPTIKKGGRAANASHYTLSTPESEFRMTDRGRTLPNYVREFARGARQGV